ncbi:hypothetical protein IWW38_002021 [Coemansia aciculifera]|uniref:Uncharacterized protein n=1 Tax=Coemansia aciculifera TaxID=417176 RepID=A0ACC1M4P0_9FUNG|nr:hypothetical protein IWW38_002021 [Coemansia aciculifera]
MRCFIIIAVLSCLLALCNSTYVVISNLKISKPYQVQDTLCYTTDPIFNVTVNQAVHNIIAISGHPTSFFANSDCTYMVAMAYDTAGKFIDVYRPIRSFSVQSTY